MWLGKMSIILYLFSIALLFIGYYMDQALGMQNFKGATFDALDTLANKQETSSKQNINTDFIFGDFVAGAKVVFGILTGDTISSAFSMLPNVTEIWFILIRLLFTLGSAFLWINIITGRDL